MTPDRPSLMSDEAAQAALRRIAFHLSDTDARRCQPEITALGEYLRAVASRATPPLPAGFVAVPREATEAMLDSYPYDPTEPCDRRSRVRAMWHHMLAAAPPAQPAEPFSLTRDAVVSGLMEAVEVREAEIDRLRAQLVEAANEREKYFTPDLFWDADNPDDCGGNTVMDVISTGDYAPGELLELQRAYKLPNILVRVIEVPQEGADPDIDFAQVAEGAEEINAYHKNHGTPRRQAS